MHHAMYHFINALGILSLTKKWQRKQASEDDEEDDDEVDVDVSMDSADNVEAMADTMVVDFELGDTLGKLLAFVQVQVSSKGICEYLAECYRLQGIKLIEILLWVHSWWRSLSHCLGTVLMDYRLTTPEWKLVKLVHKCLKVTCPFV